jgi:hypothetical protein
MGSQHGHLIWTAGIACLLGACSANPDRYPSLAVRDAERVTGTFDPAQRPAPEPVAPVADAITLDALVARADAAHKRFLDSAPGTTRLVESSQGLGPESNEWSRAQTALADLQSHRSDAAIALGDIDLLAAEAATTFAPREEIAAAQAKVSAWVDEQDRTLTRLVGVAAP